MLRQIYLVPPECLLACVDILRELGRFTDVERYGLGENGCRDCEGVLIPQ